MSKQVKAITSETAPQYRQIISIVCLRPILSNSTFSFLLFLVALKYIYCFVVIISMPHFSHAGFSTFFHFWPLAFAIENTKTIRVFFEFKIYLFFAYPHA